MNNLRKKLLHEMQFRNYSQRTIRSYNSSLSGLAEYYNKSLDKITVDQVKKLRLSGQGEKRNYLES